MTRIVVKMKKKHGVIGRNSPYSPTSSDILNIDFIVVKCEANLSISQFKSYLLAYYQSVTEQVYDVEVPETFKTVCVKCH